MTKKNTSVVLPGGLAGLVRETQQSASSPIAAHAAAVNAAKQSPAEPQAREAEDEGKPQHAPAATAEEPRQPSAEATEGWRRFEERARHYHRASNLGAVYIDRDLKRALSRLRASSLGVSTSALVSAIVEQFLADHEQDVARLMGE